MKAWDFRAGSTAAWLLMEPGMKYNAGIEGALDAREFYAAFKENNWSVCLGGQSHVAITSTDKINAAH